MSLIYFSQAGPSAARFTQIVFFPSAVFRFTSPALNQVRGITKCTRSPHTLFAERRKTFESTTSIKPFFIANPHSNSFHTSPKRFRLPPATEWLGLFSLPSTPNNLSACVGGEWENAAVGVKDTLSHPSFLSSLCAVSVSSSLGWGRKVSLANEFTQIACK